MICLALRRKGLPLPWIVFLSLQDSSTNINNCMTFMSELVNNSQTIK